MKYDLDDEEVFFDALDGLHAYDGGSIDSGIHDEELRAACKAKLEEIRLDGLEQYQRYSKKFSGMISRLLFEACMSPEAIEQGYGYEDMCSFLEWLHEEMGVPD